MELRPLPEVQEPDALDFVEIETGRLGDTIKMLHQLGFSLGGYHRDKEEIQVWTQGPVRIVIEDHGPTGADTEITGFGLRTADLAAAQTRALMVRAQPVGSEESAVYTPNGTEIFFTGPDVDWLGASAAWMRRRTR